MVADNVGDKKLFPTKWWQWAFVYPALVIAMLGAIPTFWQQFKAWRLEVGFSEVQKVEEQRALWERNVECLSKRAVYEVDEEGGGIVGVTLCKSGDALLRYQYKEENTQYVWVRAPKKYKGKK